MRDRLIEDGEWEGVGPPARERFERMRDDVRALYDRNRQRGHAAWCGYDYDFVCPSMGTYPFQWFWTPASTRWRSATSTSSGRAAR